MSAASLVWPLLAGPRIERADRFYLDDRHYCTQYHGPTHALHLYGYTGAMRLGKQRLAIGPGTLTITPAGVRSSYDVPQPGYHWCVHFHPVAATGETTHLPLHLALGPATEKVESHLGEIARLHALSFRPGEPGAIARAAAESSLQSLLLQIAMIPAGSPAPSRSTTADAAIQRVLALINAQLDRPLAIPWLASQAGLSQNYLARCFREQFGITLPRYILERRIDVARQLLRSTDLPVKAVAVRTGFADAQHFNKQFRRLAGLNPSAYRAHAQPLPGEIRHSSQ